jgi:hypothetical protein
MKKKKYKFPIFPIWFLVGGMDIKSWLKIYNPYHLPMDGHHFFPHIPMDDHHVDYINKLPSGDSGLI